MNITAINFSSGAPLPHITQHDRYPPMAWFAGGAAGWVCGANDATMSLTILCTRDEHPVEVSISHAAGWTNMHMTPAQLRLAAERFKCAADWAEQNLPYGG